MKKLVRFGFGPGLASVLAIGFLTMLAFSQDAVPTGSAASLSAGQSATLLPDGSELLLGGGEAGQPSGSASLLDSDTGQVISLAAGLGVARAWHTATVQADGKVAIIGGRGAGGITIQSVESFDPETQSFASVAVSGIIPRSHHTATLLSNGEVLIVGGISATGATLGSGQVWNPMTGQVRAVKGALAVPRSGHTAKLLPDGNVLFQGGVDANGNRLASSEFFNSATGAFTPTPAGDRKAVSPSDQDAAPTLAGSIPANHATGVPVNTTISLRFSEPLQVQTVNSDTLTLSGPEGKVMATIVPTEGGMLAFVNPGSGLAPNATYTVAVDGAMARNGLELATTSFSFTTAGSALGLTGANASNADNNSEFNNAGVWLPTSDWRTHLPPSPWQSLPPLRAPAGVTAVSGQVLTIDGNPLSGVTLQIGRHAARSDGSGRFLMPGVEAGKEVLLVDGTTANHAGKAFGIFEPGVVVQPRITNVLSYTIWMPVLDMAHAATVPSPTRQETVVSNPLMPGLELHVPAGTTITDMHGNTVRTISMTAVPLDRPPFPLPPGVDVPIYFTIQPGGAQLWSGKGKWAWAQLYYPNPRHLVPGTHFNFWNYDASQTGWYVYGQGRVTPDGSQVVPDPGVGIWSFSGAMVGNAGGGNTHGCGSGPGGSGGGDPVDCSTGLPIHSERDLYLADIIPIAFERTYVGQDNQSRPFGIGTTDSYEMYLTAEGHALYTQIFLVLPDGEQVEYQNTNSNTGDYSHALFVPILTSATSYYGSTITWNGGGWNLRLKNGSIYKFPDSFANNNPAAAALTAISDRNGNTLTITRDANYNITQITSPNGRWIQFQHDSSNRITQATDVLGRTVVYTYDSYSGTGRPTCASAGMLCAVTDANGGVTSYSYSAGSPPALLTISDQLAHTKLTLSYGLNQVAQETLADGTSKWNFCYGQFPNLCGYTMPSCNVSPYSQVVSATSITDPNGNVEVKFIDNGGYVIADEYAPGVAGVQQIYCFGRDLNTALVTEKIDPLGRQFNYSYDANGNVTGITCQNCLSQAVNTTLSYDPVFNQVTSLTDALNHTWTVGLDTRGNPITVTDPLNHQLTLGWNNNGQLTSFADGANDTVSFSYSFGDLAAITDPLGNTTKLFIDNAGRLISQTDALGNQTQLSYDPLDRLTQIADANGGLTRLAYNPTGTLQSVTDANNNQTSYTYDSRDRLSSRTDALTKSESYGYDANGNLTSHSERNGNLIAYAYDALNRPAQVSFSTPGKGGKLSLQSTINYSWDAGNRVTKAVDSIAGTITRTYDGLNDLTAETTPQGTVNYSYDNGGRRASMQVAGQGQVGYSWDEANRLTGVTQGGAGVGMSYDNANRRTCLTLPNGVIMSYAYDADSRPTGLSYGTGGSCASPPGNLGNLTYTYDAGGRRIARGGSLATVTLPGNVAGGSSTSYNADNEQSMLNGTAHSYDNNGNLTGDGTNTYSWDARNHLSTISQGRTTVGSFVYDGFGRRMKKTVSGVTTEFLYDGLNPVQELNGSNGVVANLLMGLGIDERFTRTDASGAMSFLTDALGSTIGLVNAGGSIATSYTYDPFGATTVGGSVNANPYQFTGRENDGNGLYFYRARYYSPTFQRFIAQDPIGFAGGDANLYGYVLQDPTIGTDPRGLDSYFFRLFVGVGGGVEIGTNPDNTSFMTIDIGFGDEFGYGYNPIGTSPGYEQNGSSSCSSGVFTQLGMHLGGFDFGIGSGSGINFTSGGSSPYYNSGPSIDVSGPIGNSVDIGGSAGGRFGFHP